MVFCDPTKQDGIKGGGKHEGKAERKYSLSMRNTIEKI